MNDEARRRRRLHITGTVQGVGFRPFVHRLARDLALTGAIGNDDAGVWCEIQGPPAVLDRFHASLRTEAPPLASIDHIDIREVEPLDDEAEFRIAVTAPAAGSATASIPPDVAPCVRCSDEIDDVRNRRHGYAFTCCTDCGPRYAVVEALPYDRNNTSMAEFALCVACEAEYASPGDRRHHAQATCCTDCGPTLTLHAMDSGIIRGDPIEEAAAMLRRGLILGLKGVGGFQLLCRADDDAAVRRLRLRKQRDDKPFAVMASSVDEAHTIATLDQESIRALTGGGAPIVLAPRRSVADGADVADVADGVAPGSRLLGVMLPASPAHLLLARSAGLPLVCTSGNRSNEPIVTNDADALVQLREIADALLTHDRRIARHADDSVGQAILGRFQLLRRARGFAPRPVRLPSAGPTVLGVGAEMKNTVCLASGRDAHVSVHLGDLEHPRTLRAFEQAIADLIAIQRADPALVVHDLHPEYLSTKFAAAQELAPTLAVQHHHAHLAACLTDNGIDDPAIGVTFDGLGWGTDATLWGGEFLVGDASGFQRAAHLRPVPMPGHGAAIREPWRMAAAHLREAFGDGIDDVIPELPVMSRHGDALADVVRLCSSEHTIVTSSMGRLFDAVAAMCDLADSVSYEGQAAIMLEQAATDTSSRYEWTVDDETALVADPTPLVKAVVDDLRRGVSVGVVAGGFHRGVADLVGEVCVRLRKTTGLNVVALTGGVFQNRLLVELVVPILDRHGFQTLRHAQVPPNDGGISLGQVAVGRAHLDMQ